MAGNKFQIKRTGVPGRLPNTTDSGNSAFIDVGELAFNFSDGILYSSDGNNAIEIGANVTNQNITGTLTANGTTGSLGQVLTSNGSGIYWGSGVGSEDGLPPGGFDGQALVKLSNTDYDAIWVTLTTDQISQGNTNLYFIEAPNDGEQYVRQNEDWVVVNIPPGYDSNNFSDDFALKNTDDLDEGNTNLYFTDQRSIDATQATIESFANDAYTNAIAFATSLADDAFTNAVAEAASLANDAFTNAVSEATNLANDAFTNAVTEATSLADDAYTNAVSEAVDLANNAFTNAVNEAVDLANAAFSNAVSAAVSLSDDAFTNAVAEAASLADDAFTNAVSAAVSLSDDAFTNAVSESVSLSDNAFTNAVSEATDLANDAFTNAVAFANSLTAEDVGAVPVTRTLIGGDGIQVIGDLSADRTIEVDSTVFRTSGGQTINGTVSIQNDFVFNSDNANTTSTSETTITQFSASLYGSAKIIVQVADTSTNEKQISELLVAHNGTDAYATEYGVVFTGALPLASFDVDISNGNVRLLATTASTNLTTYTISKTLMV